MPVNQELNVILKEVWRIDEKLLSGSELSAEEKNFYNQHLKIIKNYYANNNEYWSKKVSL